MKGGDNIGGLVGQSLLPHRQACGPAVMACGTFSPMLCCQKCSRVCHLYIKVSSCPGITDRAEPWVAGPHWEMLGEFTGSNSRSLCTQGLSRSRQGWEYCCRFCILCWHPFPQATCLLCAALGGDSSPETLQQVIS